MKKFLLISFFFLVPTFAYSGDELATYSIRLAIDGLLAPNLPPGSGDRSILFEVKFPADSPEAAEVLWYEHLALLFGQEDQERLRALSEKFKQIAR